MRSLILILPMMLISGAMLAQQSSAKEPSSAVLQSCLLGTGPDQWNTLKLSQDQMQRMQHIQEACKLECEGAGVQVVPNPISTEDGASILKEVRMVLSEEQYKNWVAYCEGIGRE